MSPFRVSSEDKKRLPSDEVTTCRPSVIKKLTFKPLLTVHRAVLRHMRRSTTQLTALRLRKLLIPPRVLRAGGGEMALVDTYGACGEWVQVGRVLPLLARLEAMFRGSASS